MEFLRLHERREGAATVLAAQGELDAFSGLVLTERLGELLAVGRFQFVLDVAGVSFCDVHGIRVVICGHARAQANGGWLHLAQADWRMRTLLAALPSSVVLPVFNSVPDALAAKPG